MKDLIRCNQCMKLLSEESVKVDDKGNESCPYCHSIGCLMDIPESEPDRYRFSMLVECKDFEQLRNNLDVEDLMEINNEILDYESSNKEFHTGTTVTCWYEGLIDTDEFIKIIKEDN